MLQLVLLDRDLVLGSDVRKDQPETDPALRDAPILLAGLLLGLLAALEGLAGLLHFLDQLLPDGLELEIDHPLRDETLGGGQMVEQLALHFGAPDLSVLLLELVAHLALEVVQVGSAIELGQIVVDQRLRGRLDRLDLDVERRGLARDLGARIVVGKVTSSVVSSPTFVPISPLETRDQRVRAKHDPGVLRLPTLEGNAVDLSLEIDDDAIAVLRRTGLGDRRELGTALRHALQRLVDLRVLDLGLGSLERDRLELDRRHVGQDLDRHGELEIGPSSNDVTSIFGRSAGRRSCVLIAWRDPSLTVSSRTSPSTRLPCCLRNRVTGTLPGRKPGMRIVRPRSVRRVEMRPSISEAGTVILYSRLRPSAFVSVTCIYVLPDRVCARAPPIGRDVSVRWESRGDCYLRRHARL